MSIILLLNNKRLEIFEFKKIFLGLIFLFEILSLIYNSFINENNSKNELKEEIFNAEKYYKICQNGLLLNEVKTYKKNENPTISIISTIYFIIFIN